MKTLGIPLEISQFELSIQSYIYLSDFVISSGLTENFGWSVVASNDSLFGNFSIIGNNNGDIIPSTSGTFFQLTANIIHSPSQDKDQKEFVMTLF